jgi:protocatechuate 3,4-dioxygenase beta subunit
LSDQSGFEAWHDQDTTITDSNGVFLFSGVGSAEKCIYIRAETFAAYIGFSLDLPKNSDGTFQFMLEPGAEVYGRVIDANGRGIADARVSAHIFSEQLREFLRSPYPNLKQATTDSDGYYELFDLPAGVVSVSVNSSLAHGNRNIAEKRANLKAGSAVELNFGDEVGFTLSGTVRAGQKLFEKASVYIHFQDQSTKRAYTDSKGRFQITGVPSGTHKINTNYYPDFVRPGPGSLDQQRWDSRPVTVEDNIEIDIDLGDGSVRGKIPDQFEEPDKLLIRARRSEPAKSQDDLVWPRTWMYFEQPQWQYAGTAKIDPHGTFKCSNLREGQYYLLLLAEGQTAAVSGVFELAESEHLEDMTLNVGSGRLRIHVLDSQTQSPVPNAMFGIKNWDLDAIFYSKKLAPETKRAPMITNDHGNAEFSDLPNGRYAVWVESPGYLTAASDLLNVSDGKITPVTVCLETAAMARFELSQELQNRITADTIYLRCRVTNLDTQQLIPNLTLYRQNEEHMVWLASTDPAKYRQPVINLPQGRYDIEYHLYQDQRSGLSYNLQPQLLQGTISVELQTGQTELITISEQP